MLLNTLKPGLSLSDFSKPFAPPFLGIISSVMHLRAFHDIRLYRFGSCFHPSHSALSGSVWHLSSRPRFYLSYVADPINLTPVPPACNSINQHPSTLLRLLAPFYFRKRKISRLNSPQSSPTPFPFSQGCFSTPSMSILLSTPRLSIARIRSMLSSLMIYGTRRSRSMISSIL